MSSTLIETLQGLVTPGMIATASQFLGEGEKSTNAALGGAASVILARLVDSSGNSGLMGQVTDMVTALGRDPSGLNDVKSLLAEGIPSSAAALAGNQLIGALFGPGFTKFVAQIASAAGIRATSASALFSLAAPLVLSALGKRLGGSALSGATISALLSQERANLVGAISPALASLGIATPAVAAVSAASASAPVSSYASEAAAEASAVAAAAASRPSPVAATPTAAAAPGPNAAKRTTAAEVAKSSRPSRDDNIIQSFAWLLVPLAFIGWLYWEKVQKDAAAPPPAPAAAPTPAEPAAAPEPAPAPAAAPVVDPATGLMKIALPGGAEISAAENGVESRMLAFINDPNAVIEKTKWFEFDRLNFETGSAMLTADSKAQAENIAAILNAYPNVKIKVGGYTDNVGQPESNLKLSDDRAKAVMAELVTLGIASDRLEAEGYGEQHPIASNDTEEGRAQNRRTAVSVRAK
ncbi:MAG: OmpA family protein [Hyphomicrobium sp.]|nr:OmpA family protein [Hyphomicrobium sp.]